MLKIKAFLQGKKVYVLMMFAIFAALLQYFGGFDFGIKDLPPAESLGDLAGQLWAFAVASGFRAAIASSFK